MTRISFLLVAVLITLNACSSNKQESKEAKPSAQVQSLSAADSAKYLELGDDLVSTTRKKLASRSLRRWKKAAWSMRRSFCNLVAYPIVDSLSKVHNARIRRVSDKPRNPKDAMDDEEQKSLCDVCCTTATAWCRNQPNLDAPQRWLRGLLHAD